MSPAILAKTTHLADNDGIISLNLYETPTTLYMSIVSNVHEFPNDFLGVEYKRMGVSQDLVMVGRPQRSDGLPMLAEAARILADEGQTLLDLAKPTFSLSSSHREGEEHPSK